MNTKTFGGVLLLAAVVFTKSVPAAEIVRPVLVVRTYHSTPIAPAEWRVTTRETTAILSAAGIDVQWVACSVATATAESESSRCARPFLRNEVAVRIVRLRTPSYSRELPLGESLLDRSLGAGTLATIYLDRVEWLARAGRISCNRLLARAIAHELAHLLLGTSAHSTSGLMRPVWTRDELIRGDAADWVLRPVDSARIREAYERRERPSAETVKMIGSE